MARDIRSTTGSAFARLVSVSVYLCAFALLPLLHHPGQICSELCQGSCPCQEDEGTTEVELVVGSTLNCRLDDRHHGDFTTWPHENHRPLAPFASCAGLHPAIVGHILANGLRAPLLL